MKLLRLRASTRSYLRRGSSRGRARAETGSITVVISAVVILLVVVASIGATVVMVYATQVRTSQAADLAALAGAQRAWLDEAGACPTAAAVAAEHRARVLSCTTDVFDVQVKVAIALPPPVSILGDVRAEARAGPPE